MSEHTQELRSRCCGATMSEGLLLAGCAHNWICDKCGLMCTAINIAAVPDLLSALEDLVKAHVVKMGKGAVNLRVELAKAAIEKANKAKGETI